MTLLIYFLRHMIMCGLEMKNWLMQLQEKVINKVTIESDEEVKEWKGLKILTPNKLLTGLQISLITIKVGNISYKLKKDKYYIFWFDILKSRKKFVTI